MDNFEQNREYGMTNQIVDIPSEQIVVANLDSKDEEMNRGSKNGKKKYKRGLMSYVIVGLICTTIGGAAAGIGTLYVLPHTSAFKQSDLYKSLAGNKNTNTGVKIYKTAAETSNGVTMSIPDIAKKVGPAVVGISTKSISDSGVSGWPFNQQQEEDGFGSGIIFSEDGYILTNNHVVSGASEIKVVLNNGKEVAAKVINTDPDFDLAVVKITDKIDMPGIAEFGDSDNLVVGETAVAIGNPMGKELLGSVTVGVVSALNREIEVGNRKLKYIQTDAAINPGNSGGALVNSLGQVIGINTAKMGGNGVEGLGFSIPINEVKPKIEGLLKPALKLGIGGMEITADKAKRAGVPVGFYVQSVQELSSADRAGIRAGDIITKFDGQSVKTVSDINAIKAKHSAGDVVKVQVDREGKTLTLDLKLAEG